MFSRESYMYACWTEVVCTQCKQLCSSLEVRLTDLEQLGDAEGNAACSPVVKETEDLQVGLY